MTRWVTILGSAWSLIEVSIVEKGCSGLLSSKEKRVYDSTRDVQELQKSLTDFLTNEQLSDIVSIPLRGKSQEADYMIVATGRSSRQVLAACEKLREKLKTQYGLLTRVEGLGVADWVLVDAGDIVIHIFRPEVRDYYQLEKMWEMALEV